MPNLAPIEILPLAGYPIQSTTAAALNAHLHDRLATSTRTALIFANTNLVLKCQPIRAWLASDEVTLVNDGIGLDIAAQLIHARRYRENLNGTDFVPYLFRNAPRQRKVYLFGGKPGIAEKVAAVIERDLGQRVVGLRNGYTGIAADELHAEINRSGAEIVLVALGNPLQEEWIRAHMPKIDATLFIGVGGLFDFMSGAARRAPLWIQKLHCEWLFRLSQEPRRLFKRYSVDLISFFILCFSYRVKGKQA